MDVYGKREPVINGILKIERLSWIFYDGGKHNEAGNEIIKISLIK